MIENLSFILLTLIMAWFACAKAVTTKEAVSVSAPTREGINVASISKFEKVPAAKERLIKDKVFILEEKMAQDYSEGQKKRDAHPKNPACLQAEFIVEPNIPAELKMGIFASPGTYPAWIRISSSSGTIQPDKIMGGKGRAVPGAKRGESPPQDFKLMSYPVMPSGTVKLFHDAIYSMNTTEKLRVDESCNHLSLNK